MANNLLARNRFRISRHERWKEMSGVFHYWVGILMLAMVLLVAYGLTVGA